MPITAYVTSSISKEEEAFVMYPNPLHSGQMLHITQEQFQNGKYLIYDATGAVVVEGNTDQTIAIYVKPGLYLIKLINKKNESTLRKLLVK